jgi:septum formation protein
MKIILGSRSEGRRRVLKDAGFDFELASADIDEEAIRHDDYELLPQLIARAKADALAVRLSGQDAQLITADTVVTFRGELREKPQSEAQAREWLRSYNPGEPAWVNTAVVVTNLSNGKLTEGFEKAAVYFKHIPDEVIEQAIQEGYIFGCSGGFAIETALSSPYVEHYTGSYSAIVGLPLELTKKLLEEAKG